MKEEQVMERVYETGRLWTSWQQVKRNDGAAGVDKMTVREFEEQENKYLTLIHEKLKAGHYRFKPARRVLIPKPGSPKQRKLGIPTIMDRIVSQSVNSVFEETFGPDFTSSNFGFRKGKSQHQAIRQMRQIIQEGYKWCALIDLMSFFDEIPHGLILKLIRRKIRDERLVTLIARALKAGVIVDGKFEKTEKGCPQGSPVSPMISNIVLNELDHELERRGHKYVRWADDFLIFVKSKRAGERVMSNTTRYLEGELGLLVNKEKSEVTSVDKAEFLSFQIQRGKIQIGEKARKKFKRMVKELTKRNNPLSMRSIIHKLNEYIGGWMAYMRIQEFKRILEDMDRFIRNRLRSMQLAKWKKPKKFQRIMIKAGKPVREAKQTWVHMTRWQSVFRQEVLFTLNNQWFRRLGLISLEDFTNRNLEFQFNR